ncbi:MAG: hypothetical protein EBR93_04200 [Bacteroidetes bacterium]|nr:hypothetical protein [Bacteroidota bacterium]
MTSIMPFRHRGNGAFAKDAKTKNRMPFVGQSWNQMAAHVFAMQQTKAAHKDRLREHVNLHPWHNLPAFWEAAQSGTRLPKPPDSKRGTNDKFMPEYAAVYEHGHWFEQCFEKIGNLSNLMSMFLTVCGMDMDTTHGEFIKGLM